NAESDSNSLQPFGHLCCMRMLIRQINLQTLYDALAELVLGKHPENSLANYFLWLRFKDLAGGNFSQSTRIKSVPSIHFFIEFFAGEFNLFGVDNDDVISREKERGVLRS